MLVETNVTASDHGIDVTKDGTKILVADPSGIVKVYSFSDLSDLQSITVGVNPQAIATSSDGRFAIVCNYDSDDLSVIDLTNMNVIQTIGDIPKPYEVCFDDTGRFAFVVNSTSGNDGLYVLELNEEPTPTPSFTPTSTFTYTPTPTFTFTPTATFTPTNTPSSTFTFSPTNTPTSTSTYTSTPTKTPIPIIPERADINEDGYVDYEDQLLLMENWHRGQKFTPTPVLGKVSP